MPVAIPATGTRSERVEAIARITKAHKTVTRGASGVAAGAVPSAPWLRLGILKPFVDHQRLVHTFATNLRGPEQPISFLGAPIDE